MGKGCEGGVRFVWGPALITIFRCCSMSCLLLWKGDRQAQLQSCQFRWTPLCCCVIPRWHLSADEPSFPFWKICCSITSAWRCKTSSLHLLSAPPTSKAVNPINKPFVSVLISTYHPDGMKSDFSDCFLLFFVFFLPGLGLMICFSNWNLN